MRAKARRVAALSAGAAVVLVTAACSASFELDGSSVDEKEIADKAAEQVDKDPEDVVDDMTCDESLPTKGTGDDVSIRCEFSVDDDTYEMTVTSTDVEGSDPNLTVEVDEKHPG